MGAPNLVLAIEHSTWGPAQCDRLHKDGKFAVLYSTDIATGWYTDHRIITLLFSPYIANIICKYGVYGGKKIGPLYGKDSAYGFDLICEYVDKSYNIGDSLSRDSKDIEVPPLQLEWVPNGVKFAILKINGEERCIIDSEIEWII